MESSTFGQSLFSRPFLQDGGFVDPKTDRERAFKGLLDKRHSLRLDGMRNLDGLCRCTNIDPQSARVRAQELRPPSCEQMQSTSSLKLVFI